MSGIDAKSDTLCRWDGWLEPLSRFYAIAYRAGMERAAEICQTEWSNVAEKMYGEECADAILAEAHAKNQPESTHDTGNV